MSNKSKPFELQFPTGDFTHSELAQLNGKTNQQVWTRYQDAIKNGRIISAGTRKVSGKGKKPSLLWKLNPNYVAPVIPTPAVTPTVAPATAPTPAATPEDNGAVVLPTEEQIVAATSAPAETPATPPTPTTTEPVAAAEVPSVEVNPPAPVPTPEPTPTIVVDIAEPTLTQTVDSKSVTVLSDEACPSCGNPLVSMPDATGTIVWCSQSPEVCKAPEAPFGHGLGKGETALGNALNTLRVKFGQWEPPAAVEAPAPVAETVPAVEVNPAPVEVPAVIPTDEQIMEPFTEAEIIAVSETVPAVEAPVAS